MSGRSPVTLCRVIRTGSSATEAGNERMRNHLGLGLVVFFLPWPAQLPALLLVFRNAQVETLAPPAFDVGRNDDDARASRHSEVARYRPAEDVRCMRVYVRRSTCASVPLSLKF